MSSNRADPAARSTLAIGQALQDSAPLARLARRLQESRARFETIQPLLPPALCMQVQPGPVDDDGWALLAANGAVSAKLRQLLPMLETRLLEQGWPAVALRIRIRSTG